CFHFDWKQKQATFHQVTSERSFRPNLRRKWETHRHHLRASPTTAAIGGRGKSCKAFANHPEKNPAALSSLFLRSESRATPLPVRLSYARNRQCRGCALYSKQTRSPGRPSSTRD